MANNTIDIKIKSSLDSKGFRETRAALESLKKAANSVSGTAFKQQTEALKQQAAAAKASQAQMNALAASYRAQAAESNKISAASRAQVAMLREQAARQKAAIQTQQAATASFVQYAQAQARAQAASGNYAAAAQTLARALNSIDKESVAAARLQAQLVTVQTKGAAAAEKAARETLALAQAQARLKVASGDLAGAQQVLIKALAQIAPNTKAAISAQTQLVNIQNKVASGFSAWIGPATAATSALAAVAAAITGLNSIAGGISIAADFESAMALLEANIASSVGSQEELAAAMAAAGEKAKALGNDLTLPAVSAGSAATAINELVKGGLALEQAMAASLGTLQLAAAGMIEDGLAAEYVTAALNGFGLAGEDAVMVADQFAAGAAATATDVKGMADALRQGGGLFSSYQTRVLGGKEALTQFNTAVGVLATVGIQGQQAGTYIASAMERMANPTERARGLMKTLAEQIGITGDIAYDANGQMRPFEEIMQNVALATADMSDKQRDATIATLFLTEGSKAVIPILNAMKSEVTDTTVGWNGIKQATTQAGAASTQAAAQMAGLNGAVSKLQSQVESLALNAFEPFLPILADIVLGFAQFAESASQAAGPLAKDLIGGMVMLGDIIEQTAIPALYGAIAATTLYASVNSATLIPALAKTVTAVAASTSAFVANAVAVAAAALPYVAVAAAVAVVSLKWDEYNKKIDDANRKMLESRQWWTDSADAVEKYSSGLVKATPAMNSTANTIKILRDQIEEETRSLGERMLRGKVSQAQYEAEMAAINRKVGGLKAATGELERLMQAEVATISSSMNATAAYSGVADGVQIVGRQAALTIEELQELATELDKIYSQGGDALAKYIATEVAFQQQMTDGRAEYASKMAELEDQLAKATTDAQREGIQKQIEEVQKGYAAQEQAQAESYARQQAAQQAALGQQLIAYVQNQVLMGNVTAEKGAELAEAITKEFGVIQDTSGKTFLQMAADIDAWAASGTGSAEQLAADLGVTRDEAVELQRQMNELEKQYTAEILVEMQGRPPEEVAEKLRDIPARVYAEVVVKETYIPAVGAGTAGRQEWEREMRPRRGGAMAGGGSFLTSRPTTILVGDNPGGVEHVQVTPISGKGKTTINPNSGLIKMAGGGSVLAGRRVGAMVDAESGSVVTTRSRSSLANDPVLAAQRTKNKELIKIVQDTQDRLVKIEEDAQKRIADINEKYWQKQVEGRRQLEYDLVTSTRDMEFGFEADDMDKYRKGVDRKQIEERERQQAQLRELNKQAQAEARELAKNDAELAEDVLAAREKAARARVELDARYNEIAAQASKKDQEALRKEYDEAVAALEARTNTEVDIAYQKAQQREQAKAEERAGVVAEAEKQKQEVVGAAIDQINAVDTASEEQKASVVGSLNDQASAFNTWSATAAAAARAVVTAMDDAAKAIKDMPKIDIPVSSGSTGSTGANAAAGGGSFVTSGPTTLTVGDNPGGAELVHVVPLSGKGTTRVGHNMARLAGGGTIWAKAKEAEQKRQNNMRTGGSSFDLSEIDPSELDKALAQMNEIARIVDAWSRKNTINGGVAKKFAETTKIVSDAVTATLDLRHVLSQGIGEDLDVEKIATLVRDLSTVLGVFQREITKGKLNVGLMSAYADGIDAAMSVIERMVSFRKELADAPTVAPSDELIRQLVAESRVITRIVQSELIKLYQEERDALAQAGEALSSSTAIINSVIDLRNNVKEVGPPIIFEKLKNIAEEANRIVGLLQGQLDPASVKMQEELQGFANNISSVVGIFNDLIGLREAGQIIKSPLSPYTLQSLLNDSQEVVKIASDMAEAGVETDTSVEAYATVTQQAVQTLISLADLRERLTTLAAPIDPKAIKRLSDDVRKTLYEFYINVIPLAEEHAASIKQYADVSGSAIDALLALADLRERAATMEGSIDPKAIKQLSNDVRKTLYEFYINVIPLGEEFAASIKQYADGVGSAVDALSAVADLSATLDELAGPIDQAALKRLSNDTRATLDIFQALVIPLTEQTVSEIDNYSSAAQSAVDGLSAVADLRGIDFGSPLSVSAVEELSLEVRRVYDIFARAVLPLTEETAEETDRYSSTVGSIVDALSSVADLRAANLGSPLDFAALSELANDTMRVYILFKDKIIPISQEQADEISRYATAVRSSVDGLSAAANLRAVKIGSPIDIKQIWDLSKDAQRIYLLFRDTIIPITEEQAQQAGVYADAVGSATSAIGSVLGLTSEMFAGYTSPSDSAIQRIISDGDRLINALSTAASRYKTEGLEAAKAYADALSGTANAVLDTGKAVEALKYGNDYLIDPKVVTQFETSSQAILAMADRLGATASALDLSGLSDASNALNGWYDSLLKAASVPWADLPNIALGGGGMPTAGGSSVTVESGAIVIYAQPGESADQIADRVLSRLSSQTGARRA
jgi:TP901 family phage tail tape measure protein